jgi:Putative prokaryotic signal transducing protein
MVEVGVYATRSDAELAQAALVVAGIPSRLQPNDAGGADRFGLAGGARLLVDESDAKDAAAILADRSHPQ